MRACRPDDAWRWVDSSDALKVYGAFFGLLLVGEVPLLRVSIDPPNPSHAGLACCCTACQGVMHVRSQPSHYD